MVPRPLSAKMSRKRCFFHIHCRCAQLSVPRESSILPRIFLCGYCQPMAKKGESPPMPLQKPAAPSGASPLRSARHPRSVYCGDNLETNSPSCPMRVVDSDLHRSHRFNSNRNYEVFWGETKEKAILRRSPRQHAKPTSITCVPRCVQTGLCHQEKTGGFYFHCDWHRFAIFYRGDSLEFYGPLLKYLPNLGAR